MIKQELSSLPNIGRVMANKLKQAGIGTVEELQTIGTEAAFIRLRVIDPGACINSLMALEGAIQGVRWHNLDPKIKDQLRLFYFSCQTQK